VEATGCYITFRFCPVYASPRHWDVEAIPETVGIPAGVFADPAFSAAHHLNLFATAPPWAVVPDGVPQNDGQSDTFLAADQTALARREGDTG